MADRTCIVTGAALPRDQLIRIVSGPDGMAVVDLAEKLPGRGVWVSNSADALRLAADRKLLKRAIDAQFGDIKIDNQSIYLSTIKSLRNEISMVSQETTLFDDTIINNIKYANENASDEEIYQVAKLSHCEEFISNLPHKYETLIGENGVRLSGGEKQRLSIARAMLKKSSIILLDEATSSLDSETENKIQNALNILTKNKTTIVIAHRLSTILNSNNIYVIDSGNVIVSGNHKDLMNTSELYKSFYEKQIQK